MITVITADIKRFINKLLIVINKKGSTKMFEDM